MIERFKFRVFSKGTKELLFVLTLGGDFIKATPSLVVTSCRTLKADNCILEQSTGLKDKNGRLIFEGDIVKAEVEEPELKVIGIITFGRYVHDLGFYVEWKGAPAESRKYYPGWRQDLFYWLEEAPLEVIGNIHENPEILETVK